MLISKLELTNYRQFSTKTVEFNAGLNTIKGRNGTGKTTIVEAIGFALFGSTMQRGRAKEWIKEGEQHGGVRLFIGDYTIERTDVLALVSDSSGNTLARNNTGIVQWVTNTFGLTPDLYRTSFYIGQKDIGSFAALSPLERTKRVEKLLRIDRLDAVKQLARENLKAKVYVQNTYEAKLENIGELVPFVDRSSELELAREKLEEEVAKQGAYSVAMEKYDAYLKAKNNWDGVVYDLEAEEKAYVEEVEHNASVEPRNKLVREKIALEKNLANVNVLEDYFTMSQREIMTHENTIKTYEKLKASIAKYDVEPIKHTDLLDIAQEIRDLTKQIKLAQNTPDVCPTCGQDWPEKVTIDIDALSAKVKELTALKAKQGLENELFELVEEFNAIELPNYTWQQLQEAQVSLYHKDAYLRLKKLADVPSELETECIVRAIEYVRKQEQYRAVAEVKVEMPVRPKVDVYRKAVLDLEDNQRHYASYETVRKTKEEYQELVKDIIVEIKELKEFVKFIDLYRKSFGANVIPLLEKNVSNIVNFLSEGKYTNVRINTDYSIEGFDFYSGSEQDSVSFALRLAISQVSRIGDFRTMLLDEVAASFDNEREQLLLQVLKEQNSQLIYITHGEI